MFGDLSIRRRLIGTFGLLLVLTVLLGAVALNRMGAVREVAVDLETNTMPSVRGLGSLNVVAGDHRFNLALHVVKTTEAEMRRVEGRMEMWEARFAQVLTAYEPLANSAAERQLIGSMRRAWDGYVLAARETLAPSRAMQKEQAAQLLEDRAILAYRTLREELDKLVQLNIDDSARSGREAAEAFSQTWTLVLGLVALSVLLGGGLAFIILRGVDRDIASVISPMQAMAGGNLSVVVPAIAPRTEIGRIATALHAFHRALLEKRAADEATAREAAAKAARAAALEAMVQGFEAEATAALARVMEASAALDTTAGEMQDIATGGAERATSLAAASEQASANVQTVAASAEEMAASVGEVARQINGSAQSARLALEQAEATDVAVGELSGSAQRIGEVVRLITGIASQTNLLALNATIEAARAGEHGKGFAVVAGEVKALATQTARATEEIGAQISAIQVGTAKAVSAIQDIARTIATMSNATQQVAAAAEEQAAATHEIGRAVAEAAAGTQDVSRHASGVTQDARQTGETARRVRGASSGLQQDALALRGRIDNFLGGIRAA
ncbi:methyl-accepting chemotaxis protein [Falsiroseomonas ponticola]|uniref:methyl-accepting chemotaxis protein n=1 Tax=Falsiroseomonas ponticola TaxID=2786951 RepID=UPI0019318A6D|nr:methyl-accepting chemotaxis protein [Roseomonas ponticola]